MAKEYIINGVIINEKNLTREYVINGVLINEEPAPSGEVIIGIIGVGTGLVRTLQTKGVIR